MIEGFAGAASYNVAYALIILAVSVFCLTSLDTGTRLGRFMFTEFFLLGEEDRTQLTGWKKVITNPYVSTLVTVGIGGAMAVGGYAKIWPLFGSANQLLAGLALLAVAAWLGNIGKNNKMFMFPMAFMLIATLTALIITLINNIKKLAAGTGTMSAEGLQILFGVLLVILAINLAIEGIKTIRQKKTIQTAE
jgi:carbon starvation protein